MKLTLEQRKQWAARGVDLGADAGVRWCGLSVAERKDVNGAAEYVAIANTAGVDLEGDVVVPEGGDPSLFQRYKSVYWGHEYWTPPVGSLRFLKLEKGVGWRMHWRWASTDFAQDVKTLVDEEAVNGVSIGFEPVSAGPPSEDEVDKYGPHERTIRAWNWFETSVVAMPCNPEALIDQSASGGGKFIGDLDRLVTKGRIKRENAKRMGLPDKRRVIVVV